MSLHPTPFDTVPPDTAAVARAVFPQAMAVSGCATGSARSLPTSNSPACFPKTGQPAECPWRLALATLLQFSENLSDRRAANAVRSRIDWIDLLGLPQSDLGFDAAVLCAFRSRLVKGKAEALLFDRLLAVCREQGFLAQRGRQRNESTHVLGAVRALNRLGCAIETLRAALNVLAAVAPDWLRQHVDPAWTERSERRADDIDVPKG